MFKANIDVLNESAQIKLYNHLHLLLDKIPPASDIKDYSRFRSYIMEDLKDVLRAINILSIANVRNIEIGINDDKNDSKLETKIELFINKIIDWYNSPYDKRYVKCSSNGNMVPTHWYFRNLFLEYFKIENNKFKLTEEQIFYIGNIVEKIIDLSIEKIFIGKYKNKISIIKSDWAKQIFFEYEDNNYIPIQDGDEEHKKYYIDRKCIELYPKDKIIRLAENKKTDKIYVLESLPKIITSFVNDIDDKIKSLAFKSNGCIECDMIVIGFEGNCIVNILDGLYNGEYSVVKKYDVKVI